MSRILLSLAHMGGGEKKYVDHAFETNWIVPLGPNVNLFEDMLADFLGIERGRVVALSAGTAAIHLGLVMLGVSPGDEVICQSFTFSASANPVRYCGANPVFVDSDPESSSKPSSTATQSPANTPKPSSPYTYTECPHTSTEYSP